MVEEKHKERIRITVVGDGMTGKTCLLISYKDKKFETDYIPTVFDAYSMDIMINNVMYEMILNDTAGQEEYDRLRSLGYNKTDVFVICYSIDSADSYDNVLNKWYPELHHFKPNCPKILVATKVDLRNEAPALRSHLRNFENGLELQNKIKADAFIECSARERFHVDDVFKQALLAAIRNRSKPKKNHRLCTIL